jgi:hypothetical protein
VVAIRSSARSPSGEVTKRSVHPLAGPWVSVEIMLPETRRSPGTVVVRLPLLLVALLPIAPATASSTPLCATPLYSRMRMSA